jgi:hypothetical protein
MTLDELRDRSGVRTDSIASRILKAAATTSGYRSPKMTVGEIQAIYRLNKRLRRLGYVVVSQSVYTLKRIKDEA